MAAPSKLLPDLVAIADRAAEVIMRHYGGEVAVSTFVSGPNTTTVPLRIMSAVQFELDPSAAAVSTLLMGLSIAVMLLLSKWVDLSKAF